MKPYIAIFMILLTFVFTVSAQQANSLDARKAELKKLDKWVGQWKGGGWSQYGAKKESFTGGEIVQRKLDGLALLVEGKFTNSEGRVIHETLAVLSSDDPPATGYAFDTFLANGSKGKHVLKVLPDGYEWGFPVASGTVRFTIKIDNEVWFEIGEFSRDGKTWVRTFEMRLERVK